MWFVLRWFLICFKVLRRSLLEFGQLSLMLVLATLTHSASVPNQQAAWRLLPPDRAV
jgi:hypothetical protein